MKSFHWLLSTQFDQLGLLLAQTEVFSTHAVHSGERLDAGCSLRPPKTQRRGSIRRWWLYLVFPRPNRTPCETHDPQRRSILRRNRDHWMAAIRGSHEMTQALWPNSITNWGFLGKRWFDREKSRNHIYRSLGVWFLYTREYSYILDLFYPHRWSSLLVLLFGRR